MDDRALFNQMVADLNNLGKRCISPIVEEYMQKAANPGRMISQTHHLWFSGNISHYICMMIVNPYISLSEPLTLHQQRDALLMLYKLVVNFDFDLEIRDDCNETALEFFTLHEHGSHADKEVLKLIRQILTESIVLKMQQVYAIKRFLLKRRMRRQRAADLINARVLEYVLNPYSTVGQRLIARHAQIWNLHA